MRRTHCELCLKEVEVPDTIDPKIHEVVCSSDCRKLLIVFKGLLSDESLARLPLPGFGLYMSQEEADEAEKNKETDPSS